MLAKLLRRQDQLNVDFGLLANEHPKQPENFALFVLMVVLSFQVIKPLNLHWLNKFHIAHKHQLYAEIGLLANKHPKQPEYIIALVVIVLHLKHPPKQPEYIIAHQLPRPLFSLVHLWFRMFHESFFLESSSAPSHLWMLSTMG